MPKATKLHVKGKTTTIQKPCKVEKDGPGGGDPEETMRQFQLELCWCVQQLERSLNEKKGNEKQCKYSKLSQDIYLSINNLIFIITQ